MSKIELVDISLDYTDNGKQFHALDGISFTVEEGEFVSLIGSSGCGKSTTLGVLSGLNHPSKGKFLIDGAETAGPGPNRGVVFQHYSLFPWMTARRNVSLGIRHGQEKLSAVKPLCLLPTMWMKQFCCRTGCCL
ncbi:ATP-binding cassette domain-containing protein [Lachnospiraceae bacterium 54-53]